ncbi:MAG TPA: hypothetical protein PKD83_02440 [Ignavibacteria bacterium]|mgnify:CR=1 FL=1|nr:hypothetical protein [Ignavibacteria bacterium]
MNSFTNNTGFKFSFFQIESAKYIYNNKKQKSNTMKYDYTIKESDSSDATVASVTTKAVKISESDSVTDKPGKLTLYQNFTDKSRTYVAIKFFLPRSLKTKLILQNPDKSDGIYLINKKLRSGFHTLVTAVKNEELRIFEYYLELRAGRKSEEKKLQYVS